MAQAYLWQQRFAPPIETASVRFPKKIQFNPKCPTVNKCGLGAVTAVSIDSNAVVTLTSSYKMEGTDRFRFTVSNVLNNTSYTLDMKQSPSNYPTSAGLFGDLCTVAVSPIINEYACSTCNLLYTSLRPSAPFNVITSPSNIKWNAPIIPENYGYQTITSYTISGQSVLAPLTVPGTQSWSSIAFDLRGINQTACTTSGKVYFSADKGITWNYQTFGSYPVLKSIAMSSLGTIRTTVGDGGSIYSSVNSGVTWNYRTLGEISFLSVAMSDNGVYQAASTADGRIYASENYGVWTNVFTSTGQTAIVSIKMSSDGRYQTAITADRRVIRTNDFGGRWRQEYPLIDDSAELTDVAMSSDGRYRSIVDDTKNIYVSTNNGNNWITKIIGYRTRGVAMSDDGNYQIAVGDGGNILTTSNAWDTWTYSQTPAFQNWKGVAISFDGTSTQTFFDTNYLWNVQPVYGVYSLTDPSITVTGTTYNLSLNQNNPSFYILASNLAGAGPYSRPG